MKILKNGNIKEYQGQCKECGCLFIFDRRDVIIYKQILTYINCPYCGNKIYVDEVDGTYKLYELEE